MARRRRRHGGAESANTVFSPAAGGTTIVRFSPVSTNGHDSAYACAPGPKAPLFERLLVFTSAAHASFSLRLTAHAPVNVRWCFKTVVCQITLEARLRCGERQRDDP